MRFLSGKRCIRGIYVVIFGILLVHLIISACKSRFEMFGYLKRNSSAVVEISSRINSKHKGDSWVNAARGTPLNNVPKLGSKILSDEKLDIPDQLLGEADATKGNPQQGDNPSNKYISAKSDNSVTVGEAITPTSSADGKQYKTINTKSSQNKTLDAISSHYFATERCFKSPYIKCDRQRPKTISPNRTFKIAYYGQPHWQRMSVFNFSRCSFSNCVFHGNRISPEADVVLVYAVALRDDVIPRKLLPHQLYAITDWEPPDRVGATFLNNGSSVWNHVFKLTVTYRVDSDIFVPYHRLIPNPKPKEERPNYYQIAKQKNRTALWFVTRCNVPSRRAEYVKEMQKYIDVDIYGRCGKQCTMSGEYCTENFLQYKFYLSFENSFCTDYITEKMFRNYAPGRHIIPVVRGGGSYDKYFPKGLFINSAHFKTPKALALHLKDLASDPLRYSQQLALKDSYVLGEDTLLQEAGCEICKYFNTHGIQPKNYDMKKWLGDGHCKKASEISWPAE